jgi:periplasmic divalent cation tolerance protein
MPAEPEVDPQATAGDDGVVIVLLTGPSGEELQQMATRLVEERLAACVNILPGVTSVYRWKGGIERGSEALGIVKTARALIERLQARVLQMHPYEVPEVLVIEATGGSRDYLDWVLDSVSSRSDDGAA